MQCQCTCAFESSLISQEIENMTQAWGCLCHRDGPVVKYILLHCNSMSAILQF